MGKINSCLAASRCSYHWGLNHLYMIMKWRIIYKWQRNVEGEDNIGTAS